MPLKRALARTMAQIIDNTRWITVYLSLLIFVSAIFASLSRQMTRTTLTAKMAAIAHAIPRHTFGGIQALFF
jgi:hypothetical protein